jgi:DNA-binding response OmpR family regulator
MAKLLVIDDDEAMRKLVRNSLSEAHEIIDTGIPEEALALALEHRPDAILLDLRMPKYSGFELCQTFTSFSSTQLIPVIVISGEAGAKTKEFCRDLGAAAYFEKPVDFDHLLSFLGETLKNRRVERRSELRVRLRVPLKLRGVDERGEHFEAVTTTENIGRSSFLCACSRTLTKGSVVDASLVAKSEEYAGKAIVVRSEWPDTQYPRYGCRFTTKTGTWVLE